MDKKYDFRSTEKKLKAFWEEQEIYRYRNGKERKIFSIDTPPPTVSGNLHIGQTAAVPLYNFEIPILTDESVSMDKGTGAVMCATFGDSADMEWYQKKQLPYKKIIMPDGTINEDTAFIGGMNGNRYFFQREGIKCFQTVYQ